MLPYLSNLISSLSNDKAGELIGFLVSFICRMLLIFISWLYKKPHFILSTSFLTMYSVFKKIYRIGKAIGKTIEATIKLSVAMNNAVNDSIKKIGRKIPQLIFDL